MAKRNTNDWNENKLNRFLKEHRGEGTGIDYKPWLTIQDFPTLGKATRIMGYISKRQHNFFSDTQLKYFFLLDWEKNKILDIREHYPLLDAEDILRQESDLNLKLFKDKESHVPYILSTTFLITLKKSNGEIVDVARSIKGASELDKKITLEKLEIERRYWKAKSIDFGIVTNKDIPSIRSKNIEWLHTALMADEYNGFTKDDLNELSQGLLERFIKNQQNIRKIISEYETDYRLEPGIGLFLFKYLVANRKIHLNIDETININASGKSLVIIEKSVEGERVNDADFC